MASATSAQTRHPPATPIYILRGHAVPIHALHVFAQNLRLLSADADGWVVIWDLVAKRPVTTWKAHAGAVLEVKALSVEPGLTEIYTHGRDHRLCVWKLRAEDEGFLDKTLPVDVTTTNTEQKGTQPWLLHSLPVNALNFCAFSMTTFGTTTQSQGQGQSEDAKATATHRHVLFAVPNALDSGGIDIFHLPSERRLTTIKSDPSVKTGMLMAVNLFISLTGDVYVASAFEDGHIMVFLRKGILSLSDIETGTTHPASWEWNKIYASRPHTQPVLSLDVAPSHDYFISSSADALLIKHPIPGAGLTGARPAKHFMEDQALKVVNTKHSGQQGLRIRDDAKVFATAGWDSRVRVYSCKTMKELAVLKWHKDGCYTVAFGEINGMAEAAPPGEHHTVEGGVQTRSLAAVHQQRSHKTQHTHWLVAGSKDGKISLWDIY